MNSIIRGKNLRRAGALPVALFAAASAAAQFVPTPIHWDTLTAKESWISVSGGSVSVDGSEATYQALRQHHRSGFLGADAFRWKRVLEQDRILLVDGHALANDNEIALRVRYENTGSGSYFEGGFRESRVFYDGTGGFLPSNNQLFEVFNPALSLDRGEFWVELGLVNEKSRLVTRFSRHYRKGEKDSTTWSDTNRTGIPGATGARYVVPAFYEIDETRDAITVDYDHDVREDISLGAGVRWENIETDNARKVHRRPGEAPDRRFTHRDGTDSDLFAMHGFTELRRGEKLTLTSAAAYTKIDTNFTGSRIYGAAFDAVFDPVFNRRQTRDEGFFDLAGESQWKQTVFTGNALYLPAKHWRINAGLRFENQSQDAIAEFAETNIGNAPALLTSIDELESDSSRDFDELLGSAEATFTGVRNMVWSAFIESSSGDGDLREELVEAEDGTIDIARDTDFQRWSTKYGLNARWYPAVRLNFAAGAYHKTRDNDYDTADDTTPNTGADRYPAYIEAQKFSTDDLYVRGTWRPVSSLSVVARYDRQQTDIDSREAGLASVLSSEMTTHIIAGTLNWSPLSNLVVQGTINYVYDTIQTGSAASNQPVARQAGGFDNNYRTGTIAVFYAVNEEIDVQVDATTFRADNYRNVVALSVPYGLTARDRNFGITVNHRIDENFVVGLRYARADYDSVTSGGHRDFTANLIYARLQMRY